MIMAACYLDSHNPVHCYGCEACVQACAKGAIRMEEDSEGFRYPVIDDSLCINCGLCRKSCPFVNPPVRHIDEKLVYGGYHKNAVIRDASTSGGAFSAIVESWCDENYVIFGAVADGLEVYHTYIEDKKELALFRKSKYSQSRMGSAYADAKRFLKQGKNVLFSGTPCHIAGLKSYLRGKEYENLLTVEVVCEGVPSPLYIRKFADYIRETHGSRLCGIDYRYTDSAPISSPETTTPGKWDFQVMRLVLENGKEIKKDRWFNPFWSVWLNHLMSRPSCYECPFASVERNADVTLGDLWGVHLYCPDLYGRNGGSSLIVCNSRQGRTAWKKAQEHMFGRELDFPTALKYQGPMRGHIAPNELRAECMADLQNCNYLEINKKWAKRPTARLLWQKYVWGNRQKIWLWNLTQRLKNTFTPGK